MNPCSKMTEVGAELVRAGRVYAVWREDLERRDPVIALESSSLWHSGYWKFRGVLPDGKIVRCIVHYSDVLWKLAEEED